MTTTFLHSRHATSRLAAACVAVLAAFDVYAQIASSVPDSQLPITLPEIAVEVDSSAQSEAREREARARQSLELRAGGTSLLDRSEFAQGRASTFSDVMAYAPGVFAQTRHGDETRLSIRGSGIQRGFLLRGLALYQDGIPLNHADGSGDFQSIDPLAAQYVEIWRGANALEYGGNTLGGAVNFVSPTGRTAPPVTARAEAGSFGHRLGHVSLAGANERADGFFSLTHNRQDGYRTHSATEATRFSGNAGARLTDHLDIRFFLSHIDSKLQMPGSLTQAALNADPRQAAPNYERLHARNDYRTTRLATQLTWAPSEHTQWTTSIFLAEKDRSHAMTFGLLDQRTYDVGVDSRAVIDFGSEGMHRRLVLGGSLSRQHGDELRYANIEGRPGANNGHAQLVARQASLYGEYSHGITQALTLQAGVQATRAGRELTNHANNSGSYSEGFGGISPKLGFLYQLTATGQLYGNISRSFEAPPFGELVVRPAFPLASAQRATTAEMGYRYRKADAWVDASAYHSLIRGELLSLNDGNGVALGTVNADRTVHQGVELASQLPISQTVRVRTNYLFNHYGFKNDPVYGSNTIAGLPPHLLRAELRWQVAASLYVAPSIEWRGGKTFIDHANTLEQRGYTLLNLMIGGNLTPTVRWYVEGRNLSNRRYVASTAVQANVRARDGSYYFPGDRRSVYAGLEWRM